MKIDQSIFEQADIHNVFDDIAEQVYDQFEEVPFDDLDEIAQNAIVLIGLDGEVNNGGFIQFIENTSGEFFQETLRAAKAINNTGLIDALEKVSKQFPNSIIPTDTEARQEILERLHEENDLSIPFHELDEATKKELLSSHDNSYPIEECSFAMEETEWTKTWEVLDQWYYDNYEDVYKDFITYLKNNQ